MAVFVQRTQHEAARPREDRAPDDDRLVWIEIRLDRLEQIDQRPKLWIEILVDRRADGDNDVLRACHVARVRRKQQPLIAQRRLQERLGAVLDERHRAAGDLLQRVGVQIVDDDALSGSREHERQRQSDMAGTADDADINVPLRHSLM